VAAIAMGRLMSDAATLCLQHGSTVLGKHLPQYRPSPDTRV